MTLCYMCVRSQGLGIKASQHFNNAEGCMENGLSVGFENITFQKRSKSRISSLSLLALRRESSEEQ